MPAQASIRTFAQQWAQLLLALAFPPLRQVRRDLLGGFGVAGKTIRMGLHECKNALDAGRFPAGRDIHQYEGTEWRRADLSRRDQAKQSPHRCANQDRRGRLGAGQTKQVVDELLHVVLATQCTVAFAMAATVVAHAPIAFAGHGRRRGIPGTTGLAKTVCEQQCRLTGRVTHVHRQGQTVGGAVGTSVGRNGFHTHEYGLLWNSRQPALATALYGIPETWRGPQFHAGLGYHTEMNVRQKPERTRLSAEDWEDAALTLIAEQGVGALAVEALARQLGVTKGSFYWHFRTREALLQAALERWEQYGEREIISQIEAIPDPRERLPELFRRVAHELQPHRVYAALLKALDHPLVVPVMARVSKRRTEFLHTAYSEAGLETDEALNRARLTYAAYVGFLQLNFTLGLPRLSHEDFDTYVEHMIATLIPA